MKSVLEILLFLLLPVIISAQPTAGTTGLLNIPTAEMQRDGTFLFGGNYLPEVMTPELFSYDTGNYYLNITFLPFWEVNYRLTLLKIDGTGGHNQDRSFALRCRILKERKYIPAIVVGGNDVYTSVSGGGNQYFGMIYTVATKDFKWEGYNISITLGYYIDTFHKNQYAGLFGGGSFSPGFFKPLSLMVEYDTKAINAGASLFLFNHLYIQAFVYDMKYFCGGVQYKVYLKK